MLAMRPMISRSPLRQWTITSLPSTMPLSNDSRGWKAASEVVPPERIDPTCWSCGFSVVVMALPQLGQDNLLKGLGASRTGHDLVEQDLRAPLPDVLYDEI